MLNTLPSSALYGLIVLTGPRSLTVQLEVDLGGSLAVASKGLFATGVSTDLNGRRSNPALITHTDRTFKVTYLSSGGEIGNIIRGVRFPSPCSERAMGVDVMIADSELHRRLFAIRVRFTAYARPCVA